MKAITRTATIAAVLVILFSAGSAAPVVNPANWSPRAAAAYLDQRTTWWMSWSGSSRDRQTFCISCHTVLPYILARPGLRISLGEHDISSNEHRILDDVTKRVRLWNETKPFYDEHVGPGKSLQSRGTESVLNALILANFDAPTGKLSSDTEAALQNMWGVQITRTSENGSWPWLNFGNEPFEAKDSGFYGACLAAVAVGTPPENYRSAPHIQNDVERLREYLYREYPAESLINQVAFLWASSKLPDLLTPQEKASIIDQVLSKQESDGGWSLSALAWTWSGSTMKSLAKLWLRSEASPLKGVSDGYATGFIAFTLEQCGLPQNDAHLKRALEWLRTNQIQSEGRWPGYSLNHPHEASPTGLFMSDAATAYAVLALTGSDSH